MTSPGIDRVAHWLQDRDRVRWGCFSSLGEAFAAETLGAVGYDFVLIDLQHGLAHQGALVTLLQAVECSGAAPIVRVRSGAAAEIGYALDCGAWAVVVPMIESAAEAAAAVAAARYAPSGTRSFGPFRGRGDGCSPQVLVMVESAKALANLAEIAAVDGLLGIFVGPSDLAISLGEPVDYALGSGPHHDAIAAVGAACAERGIAAAIQTAGAEEANLRATQGFQWISMRSDWLVMRSEAQRVLLEAKAAHSETAQGASTRVW